MGKKNKKHRKQNETQIDLDAFKTLNAIDISVMLEEMTQEKWNADKHSAIENYLHYRAELVGR